MQLLRAARAACTNPYLFGLLQSGPAFCWARFFLPLQLSGEKIGFVVEKRLSWGIQKKRLAANIMLTRLAPINRNRMNVASFERNY